MSKHWSESYIGTPYVHGDADCARLVCKVRREVFGRPVPSDTEAERAASRLGRAAQMADAAAHYGVKVSNPEEGDAVLMLCCGRPSHIGVYAVVDGEPCVLHAMENAGMVVRHRLRELHRVFLAVEGFYRWNYDPPPVNSP